MKGSTASRILAARQAVSSSRLLLREGDLVGACNRAYYAMFYAAHAAMQAASVIDHGTIYKSHAGLIGAFSKELVLSGRVPATLGRALGRVLNTRLLADYDSEAVDHADADEACGEAERFVAAIEAALPHLST